MSKSMKVRLLIVFLVVAITLTPLAILYPRVTALTEIAYEDEKGSLNSDESDEYVGMGYGNAFDMFGEAEISSTIQQVTEPTTQSSTKQYQVAVKKNHRTPTEKGSEEQIKTTTTTREYETETLDYYHVKKNQDVKGTNCLL